MLRRLRQMFLAAVLTGGNGGAHAQVTPPSPSTPAQIAVACRQDFTRWCPRDMAASRAGHACLRQYWSSLALACRKSLRRSAAPDG